jgi:uracil DNA glycosylase
MEIEEIQEKFIDKIGLAGWGDKLWNLIHSPQFVKPIETLMSEVSDGKKFTPDFKDLFKAYETCDIDNLKVVLDKTHIHKQVLLTE